MSNHLPGFRLRHHAVAAGRKFFTRTNGMPGTENRHFHVVQNSIGRWEFVEGKPRSAQAANAAEGQ